MADLVSTGRYFVREAIMVVKKSGQGSKYGYFYLLNDTLLHTVLKKGGNYQVKHRVAIQEITVSDEADTNGIHISISPELHSPSIEEFIQDYMAKGRTCHFCQFSGRKEGVDDGFDRPEKSKILSFHKAVKCVQDFSIADNKMRIITKTALPSTKSACNTTVEVTAGVIVVTSYAYQSQHSRYRGCR